jgi:hypothetical protein
MKPVIIPLSPVDILGPVGYHSYDPIKKRRAALDRAMRRFQYKDIISRLNAVAIRLKNTQPRLASNLRKDMLWLKKKYRPDLIAKSLRY